MDNTTTTHNEHHPDATATRPILIAYVHRAGEEGGLQIDRHTGTVLDAANAPDWAEGLVNALLNTRLEFYHKRTGIPQTTPELLDFRDLDWIALDEDGNPTELTADPEYRADRLAEMLGLETDIDKIDMTTARSDATVTEVLISMDRERTEDEVAAFEQSKEQGFGKLTGTSGGSEG